MSQLLAYSKSDVSRDPQGDGLSPLEAGVTVANTMSTLVRKALLLLCALAALTFLLVYLGLAKSHVHHTLMPAQASIFPWTLVTNTDRDVGGASRLNVHEQDSRLDYDFFVTKAVQNPYATMVLSFVKDSDVVGEVDVAIHEESFADFSQYSELTFSVRCSPRNVLSLILSTLDERVANPADRAAYPIPSKYFSCNERTTPVSINLRDLEIPDWWFQALKVDLSQREYSLRKVARLGFGISTQSPLDTESKVTITDLNLGGRDWRPLYFLMGIALVVWVFGIFWVLRQRAHILPVVPDEKIKNANERFVPAYRQLELEPQRERQKNAILQLMATEYANPDMSVEMAVASLGINRNKINEVLKQETGLTFTGYLNKLKLTEAARLLAEKEGANIAEIAYSVGYNNVSHFNKLFKSEYGCTPKAYKMSAHSEPGE